MWMRRCGLWAALGVALAATAGCAADAGASDGAAAEGQSTGRQAGALAAGRQAPEVGVVTDMGTTNVAPHHDHRPLNGAPGLARHDEGPSPWLRGSDRLGDLIAPDVEGCEGGSAGAGGSAGGEGGAGGSGGTGGEVACTAEGFGEVMPDVGPATGSSFTQFDAADLTACMADHSLCADFRSKEQVYLDSGNFYFNLSPGKWFFAVVAPGHEDACLEDGAEGNLSDTTAGGTEGDLGSGDTRADRTFTVPDAPKSILDDAGTHKAVLGYAGFTMIQVAPCDSTPDGTYVLALCPVGATSRCDCRLEAFHVLPPG